MTGWVEILRAPVEQDLGPFSRYLRAQGIDSYVFEQSGAQCLCVPADSNSVLLHELLDQWNRGDVDTLRYQKSVAEISEFSAPSIFAQWRRFPLTLALLVASVVTFVMISTELGISAGGLHWLAAMTLQQLDISGENIRLLPMLPDIGQGWRYWTPIFLHFTWLHILFNGLMLLEMGRRIEIAQGSQRLLGLVMVCALASNLAQFYVDPGNLFGGMSGVIYALAGYCWLYQRQCPASGIDMPPGFMMIALIWLVLCMTGLVTLAGMGKIANAAHVGGLLSGLFLAALLVFRDKRLLSV